MCIRDSYRIVCLDKLTYAGNLSTLAPVMDNPNFRFAKLDICDREGVYRLFEEEHPDMVVNFAAESHVDRSIENPEVFLQTNILGTQVLMDACRKYGIRRYHQVSKMCIRDRRGAGFGVLGKDNFPKGNVFVFQTLGQQTKLSGLAGAVRAFNDD